MPKKAEGQDAGVAPEEVHADGGDGEEKCLRENLLSVVAEEDRARQERRAEQNEAADDPCARDHGVFAPREYNIGRRSIVSRGGGGRRG